MDPVDIENCTLVSDATEDVTNGMNELIKMDKINFVKRIAESIVLITALFDWPFTDKKRDIN